MLAMRNKISKLFWLLPLLLVLRFGVSGFNYDRQVIVVLENDPATLEAAYYLYGKHESTSSIVEWKNGMFEHVDIKLNEETKAFESSPAEYVPEIHDEDWIKSRIQVIGHGIIDSEDTTIGGLKGGELAETLSENLNHGKNVGRISIIGCTGSNDAQAGGPDAASNTPPYLQSFMEKLQALGLTDTTVSMRSALVSVDQNGRKLTGERFLLSEKIPQRPEVGIVWKHKDTSNLWLGETENGMAKYTQKEVGENTEIMPSKYFGVLPKDSPLYVKSDSTYEISDADALQWIDERVAQPTYDNIKDQGLRHLDEVDATMVPLTSNDDEKTIKLREIGSMQDLLTELVYHGETGPVTGGEIVHYRFGDWVVSLDPQEFYVKVEGIIKRQSGSSEEEENKVRNVREKWNNYIMTELALSTEQFNAHPGPSNDPEKVRLEKRKNILLEQSLPSDYPNMRLDILVRISLTT